VSTNSGVLLALKYHYNTDCAAAAAGYCGDLEGSLTVPTNSGVLLASSTSMNRKGRSNLQQQQQQQQCSKVLVTVSLMARHHPPA
jgi:hypothetical protein